VAKKWKNYLSSELEIRFYSEVNLFCEIFKFSYNRLTVASVPKISSIHLAVLVENWLVTYPIHNTYAHALHMHCAAKIKYVSNIDIYLRICCSVLTLLHGLVLQCRVESGAGKIVRRTGRNCNCGTPFSQSLNTPISSFANDLCARPLEQNNSSPSQTQSNN